ncbi:MULTISPECIES: NTP transferase domain-containing protein [unclassified Streptomyces]|uniref:NTP transferase domain-containing protein n=1 Tax=unclassified Streptomyces TaxID=2593676 RepID=UPI0022B5F529|nr:MULTISPECIES: NTP transferase domain-containing protein [unclassified Streptomyces]MCZ7413182.1 NTP transferase domain-containing protein [Streptomyces sp. WMMC897]MCZ7417784.1 NTP transferase domain-containing protein [Streptomyces sp. WMMC897]MCZ7432420.1 NTP transferase domain-containing protein [Streptomyces sp. WMMC1477]
MTDTDDAGGAHGRYGRYAPYDAVVLAGGAARRLGGTDKPAVTVGGRTLLDRTLAACPDAGRAVVVGPRRPTARPVTWAREARPGAGPLAALAAGLDHVTAETVLVLSADLPFLGPDAVGLLHAELARAPEAECVLATHGGRDQPLLAVHRAEPLRRELALLAAEHGRLDHLPLRLLTAELAVRRVPLAAGTAADCDTWDDIAAARARIREHGRVLEEWTTAVKAELGLDLDVDINAVLDLARDAAHGVARPAAPLTTFLVGYAAALQGGSPQDVTVALRKAAALADRWSQEASGGPDAAPPAVG